MSLDGYVHVRMRRFHPAFVRQIAVHAHLRPCEMAKVSGKRCRSAPPLWTFLVPYPLVRCSRAHSEIPLAARFLALNSLTALL